MKNILCNRALALLLLLITQFFDNPTKLKAQSLLSEKNWVIGITPGMASYFGDLSVYDFEPVNKLGHESGPMVEVYAGKKLERYFEFGLSVSFGSISSAKPAANAKFLSSYVEYAFNTRISFADVLFPYRSRGFDFGFIGGVGLTQFRSASYTISDNSIIESNGLGADKNPAGKGQNDPHLITGYYLAFSINQNWILEHKMAGKLLTTDNFDSYIGSTGINDRLIFTGLGVKYIINQSFTMKYRDLPCAGSREWKRFQIKKKRY